MATSPFRYFKTSPEIIRLREQTGKSTRVIATYANGQGLQTAEKARQGGLGLKTLRDRDAVLPLSYQAILAIAQMTDPCGPWTELSRSIARKIDRYAERTR